MGVNTALGRNDTMERIWLNSLTHAYSIVWLYHTVAKCASCDAATPRRYHGTVCILAVPGVLHLADQPTPAALEHTLGSCVSRLLSKR